jgi:ketosteroid isomerase-like protein
MKIVDTRLGVLRHRQWATAALACVVLGMPVFWRAQAAEVPFDPLDQDVLAADREFAALAAEAGLRMALERFLAPDGILFRPRPTRGRDWLDANEPPSGRLDWQPAVVELACDSSLAVTFGTWRYLPLDGPPSGAGVYLTVWRRVAGGDWRIALDQSLSTDSPPARIALEPGRTCTTSQETSADLSRADARRNDATRSLAGAPAPRGGLRGVQQGQVLGDAGADLALTYGDFVTRKPPRGQAPATLAMYVRVWQRQRQGQDDWRVAHEFVTPQAP